MDNMLRMVLIWTKWTCRALDRKMWGRFALTFIRNYNAHNISQLSAESTYYLILAIVPFFIFLFHVILFVAQNQLTLVFEAINVLPTASQEVVRPLVLDLLSARSETVLSVGILVAFWSNALGVQGIIRALNVIFSTDGREDHIIIVYFKGLLFTILWTVNGIMSLLLTVYGDVVFRLLAKTFEYPKEIMELWVLFSSWIPLFTLIVTLTILYRYGPSRLGKTTVSWSQALASALIGAALWILVTLLYRYYIGHLANMSLTYGPLVGLMALFIWINLSVRALLLGAEITVSWKTAEVELTSLRKLIGV